MKHSGILGRDLYNNYPMNVYINGVRYSLKNFAKKFNSEWEFFYFYAKMINFDPNEHERVIKILERAKDCNLINFGICEFVISRKWDELETILDEGVSGSYSNIEIL